jgi:hypothetical protein
MGGTCDMHGDVYRILMGTRTEKRLLGRSRHRFRGNVKWIVKDQNGRVSLHLAQGRDQ